MACLHSYMLHRAYYARPQTPPLRILWSKPIQTHRARASWHPSKISLIFCIFAKTDLGILQENPNVLPLFTWHPSKPRNIHAGLLTPAAGKNTHFLPPNPTDLGILQKNPNVLQLLTWRPSKPTNIHACLLTAKLSKNTVFSPAHTTTWHPSKITNSPSRQHSDRAQRRSAKKY